MRLALEHFIHLPPQRFQIDAKMLQHRRCNAVDFLRQSPQEVLGPDVFIAKPLCLPPRQFHHVPRMLGEPFEHRNPFTLPIAPYPIRPDNRR